MRIYRGARRTGVGRAPCWASHARSLDEAEEEVQRLKREYEELAADRCCVRRADEFGYYRKLIRDTNRAGQ